MQHLSVFVYFIPLYIYIYIYIYRRHETFKCFFLYKNSFLIVGESLKLPSDKHKCK